MAVASRGSVRRGNVDASAQRGVWIGGVGVCVVGVSKTFWQNGPVDFRHQFDCQHVADFLFAKRAGVFVVFVVVVAVYVFVF